MSVSPDFGHRRRTLAASAILVLAVVGAAAAPGSDKRTEGGSVPSASRHHLTEGSSNPFGNLGNFDFNSVLSGNGVTWMCQATDFPETCEKYMSRLVNETSSTKDMVQAAVKVVVEAVSEGFQKSDSMMANDPAIAGAIEVCQEVHGYILDDLNKTLSVLDMNSIDQLPRIANDLQTWLSAAVSYQETCIDAYPEGRKKRKMRNALKDAGEVTSNAMAIVDTVSNTDTSDTEATTATASSLLSSFGFGKNRRLLSKEEPAQPEDDGDDLPSWIRDADRRALLSNSSEGFSFTPNVVVAKDGSGDFTTINESLSQIPRDYEGRYVIYVKEGVYEEDVLLVGKRMINVTMYGDGATQTVITGSKNYIDGVKTFYTSSFAVAGDGFMAVDMGFKNTAGPTKDQAVALRVNSDQAIFLNCRMEGYQDTLYAHSNRQFYRDCMISGTVDFIFGDSFTIFQNCLLTIRKPLENQRNVVLAQGRTKKREHTGFVVQNCKFVAEPEMIPVLSNFENYLGRPWKLFSRTMIMESEIPDFIRPEGYLPWSGDFALNTLTYYEYANTGGGADTSKRVNWPGIKIFTTPNQAKKFTAVRFFEGDKWIPESGAPVDLHFTTPIPE